MATLVAATALTTPAVADPIPAGAIFLAPGGNDSAAGTEAAPLRTLRRALAVVPAGGTVVMRGGQYREGDIRSAKPVTIQAYPNERPWVKGSDVMTSWTAQGSTWLANGWTSPFCHDCYPHDAAKNERVVDPAYPEAGKPEQVFVDGVSQTQVASLAAVGPGSFHVDAAKRLYIGTDPKDRTIEVVTRWRALQLDPGAAGSTIRGIGFTHFSPHFNENQLGMVIVDAADVTIAESTFSYSAGRALFVAKPRAQVLDNAIVDNGYSGLGTNKADGTVVRGNRIDNNNTERFAYSNCNPCTVAGYKAAHTKNLTVTDNTFNGNVGTGFWCDLGCTDATITRNTVVDNANNGLYYEVSSRASVTGNTIVRNGLGLKIAGSDRVLVEANTFLHNTTQLGVYDDSRAPDAYSAGLGLTWNTTDTIVRGNRFDGATRTNLLLAGNATAQVNSTQMFAQASGNTVSGNQRMVWCPVVGTCTTYTSVAAFATASRLPFGTVVSGTAQHLSDPGFEGGSLWATFGSGVPAVVTTPVRTGAAALRVTTTQAGPVVAGATDSPTAVTSTVAGRTYTATCWVRSAGPLGVRIKLQEYTQAWGRASDPTASPTVNLTRPGAWYPVSVTHTAQASGNLLPLSVYANALGSASAPLFVDDCALTSL